MLVVVDKAGVEVDIRTQTDWLGVPVPLEDIKVVDVKNRKAKCAICGKEAYSSEPLEHFRYREDLDHDEYYCGCLGWHKDDIRRHIHR